MRYTYRPAPAMIRAGHCRPRAIRMRRCWVKRMQIEEHEGLWRCYPSNGVVRGLPFGPFHTEGEARRFAWRQGWQVQRKIKVQA